MILVHPGEGNQTTHRIPHREMLYGHTRESFDATRHTFHHQSAGIAGKFLKDEVTFPTGTPALGWSDNQRALAFSQKKKSIISTQ